MHGLVDIVPLLNRHFPLEEPQRLRDWSLTLWAMGIEHYFNQTGTDLHLLVRSEDAEKAVQEIFLYEDENCQQELQGGLNNPDKNPVSRRESVFWVSFVLVIFYLLTISDRFAGIHWIKIGGVSFERVMAGEWWRLLTALFLHVDLAHLAGNVLFGALFMSILAGETGSAMAWALVLGCSVLANYFSMLVRPEGTLAIGFSTAVFSSLGLLTGRRAVELMRQRVRFMVLLVPLGSGLALLAFLGSGGRHTDLAAHLFGFGIGLLAGFFSYPLSSQGKGKLLGGCTVTFCILCWFLAFIR